MNNLQQQPGNTNSWHAMYSVSDRQKVVQILSGTLKELQNGNYDAQKAANMAQEFEKFTFMKSQSRDEYLRLIKQKVTQLRAGIRNPANGNNMGGNNPMVNQNMGQNMGSGMGMQQQPNMNPQSNMRPQNMNFLQQQAQARQQSAAQIQAQLRNGNIANQTPSQTQPVHHIQQQQQQQPSQPPQPQQSQPPQQPQPQPNQQQLHQISNMIRNAPIPQALLSKIPNLPPNVNTWTQIFDCFQKKIIPQAAMPVIKEIHNTHLQLTLRQHQQQKINQMQSQRMNQQQHQQQHQQQPQLPQQQQQQQQPQAMNNMAGTVNNSNNNTPVMNSGNFNMNNLNPQQKQQLLRRQMQQRNSLAGQNPLMQQQGQVPSQPPQPQPQQQPSQPQQQKPQMVQSSPQNPQQSKPPNFTITPDDILKYSSDAMRLLTRLQSNGSIQPNLDQSQKESFIRKYIHHQKTTMWKQGQVTNNMTNVPNTANAGNTVNQAQVQRRLQQQTGVNSMPMQSQPQTQPSAPLSQQSPMINNMQMGNQQPMPHTQMNNQNSPMMQQRAVNTPTMPMNNNDPSAATKKQAAMGSLSALLPPLTDEMKLQLRQLIEEVSRNNVALKDVTMLLSQQDKNAVRDTVVRISQQYANVDSIISYFYIITRNVEGTKRLIQMKYMTKNIIENVQRGIYLAAPDLLEKLRSQYQKYFEYVKEQFAIRRQRMQSQQPQGQPPQQQFLNNQQRNGPIQNQIPQQQVQGMPQQQNGQTLMNIGPVNSWPNVAPPMQQRNNIGSSPMIPNSVSPIIPKQMHPFQSPASNINTAPPKQGGRAQNKKSVSGTTPGATGTSRKKSINKSISSVGGIPTPANNATTPAALANSIKTPNSIPTPQVPPTQSNKNTPAEQQSPNSQMKRAPSNAGLKITEDTVGTIFNNSEVDPKLAKRRELSDTDPLKFFYASLSNLLEIDDLAGDQQGLPTPAQSSSSTGSKIGIAKSPLSPVITSNEWTCEIKPMAITSSFKQVGTIRELTASDIVQTCADLALTEVEEFSKKGVKRENDEMDDSDDIDNLFSDKKPKVEDDDYKFMYEPVEFDEWQKFMVASMQ
ncbi:DEHA2F04048p [Debaryomyces hansenii CBS767]|uniref:Mediator of RNA polymerase II transcription subunit 15 n=1 Tax=Debaryomyces hansenii (strain ATCC 36239 / CBS 767 / BCRC 21394 / JCM 1990 / NBRC 0083 / IGC 2968) TaxID=284592 RepID=Q6BMM9_DEBHA|nr:DEHA2F04048p [Debaryomyces hansenii CBS767]CAG88858.2 DEHA2F04048p [Debaryomyces hansenii CBS767]|eukprot:XP_460542.2 DEHA2F04048p [Debaryomyces hansenii CBS767]